MSEGIHISLKAEEIFRIGLPGGGFPVTNSLILSTFALLVIAGIALALRRRISLVPGKIQNALESIIDAVLGLMDNVLGSRQKSEKYLPLVATIFLFILTSNWLGILPGIGSIVVRGEETAPLLRSPASDLNFTLALAIITVFTVNVLGIIAIGFVSHAKKFLNFQSPIAFFVGILEFISELAKLISFSFRLFGNVFAGEILLTIVAFLVPYVVPLFFLFLEACF